jgi:predicted O-methyltransferase YrrM
MPDNVRKAALLAGRLVRMTFTNPRGLREISGVALSLSEDYANPEVDVLPIPAVTLAELLDGHSGAVRAEVCAFPALAHSITLPEALGLALLMQKAKARRAFEFGTHRGVSTTQLAANLPEDGTVTTLDLPRDDTRTQFELDNPGDVEVKEFPRKGDLIPADLLPKVKFLTQDSATFDCQPYEGTMDFVFVDAAHSADYVRNDSEKGWRMLGAGGIIAWHDCRAQSPDVTRYLRACSLSPRRIAGTSLAFASKPAK